MTSVLAKVRFGSRAGNRARKVVAATSSGVLAAGLMVGVGVGASSADASTGVVPITTAGSGNITLPPGVQSILAQGIGGGGAGGAKIQKKGGNGGVGALVKASLDVSNIDTLSYRVAAGGAIGGAGQDGGGRGGQSTVITAQDGSIGFVAGGGGGGSTGYGNNRNNGDGNDGGDAGTANNGGGHDGAGNAGGSGGSKGNPGKGGNCSSCEKAGDAGTATSGGNGAAGNANSGQGGFGGDGYGGGGGGGLAPDHTGVTITTKSNGGGGAGGSRIDGTATQSKFTSTSKSADPNYGTAGAGEDSSVATPGKDGMVKFNWLLRPTNLHVVPASGQVTVTWTQPDQSAVVTDANLEDPQYEVYVDGKPTGQQDNTGSVITNLVNGKSYAFTVVVSSQVKTGTKYPLSTVSSTVNAGPATVPGTPAAPTIAGWGMSGDNGYVNLKWSPPANTGGATVTGYQVQQMVAGGPVLWVAAQNCGTVQGLSCQVQGLVADVNYVFRVRAENSVGNGAWSNASVKIAPHYVPPAPKNQSVGKCIRKPKKIALKNKTYPLLAPNCKSNAGQVVRVTATPKQAAGKKVRYAIFKIGKGKYKNYTAIRTYNVKIKNLKITWSAAAKARPIGQPTGQSYKAWSTSKKYQVR